MSERLTSTAQSSDKQSVVPATSPSLQGGVRGGYLSAGAAHLLLATLATCAFTAPVTVRADVIISEIMYHPASDFDEDEFLELHNTGSEAVALDGWSISGIGTVQLQPGSSIAPGGYFVLANHEFQFVVTYGFSPDGTYSKKLSNSGECIELFTPSGGLADAVCYEDDGYWPTTPDGLGPSLERINPASDDDTPRNWRASTDLDGHSAGQRNSTSASALPPWISDVSFTVRGASPGDLYGGPAGLDTKRITAADLEGNSWKTLSVTAQVEDASHVSLTYRIGFDDEITMAMHDDGRHGDGAAGDGTYRVSFVPRTVRIVAAEPENPRISRSIRTKGRTTDPATDSPSALLRLRISATGPSGIMQYPRQDDTIRYVGTLLEEPDIDTALPIFHWFMKPEDYQAALDHLSTDETEPAVLYHDGVLYDNVQVRVRGATAREYAKKHWKFKFPRGHDFYAPDLIPVPVDQFNLQGNWSDKSYLREILAFETFRDAGTPSLTAFPVRVEINGEFYSLSTYLESMDEDYLARHNIDENGAWYKAFGPATINSPMTDYEKKTRLLEGHADLDAFFDGIHYAAGADLTTYIFDNIDVPAMVNYLAVQALIHNGDHIRKNYFLYRDTGGTRRWTMHPWDMDLTFGRNWENNTVLNDVIRGDRAPDQPRDNRIIQQLFNDPFFMEMYYRRLRTLMDQFLTPGVYEDRMNELVAIMAPEAEMDRYQEWRWYGWRQSMPQAIYLINTEFLPARRQALFSAYRVPGMIPAAQSPSPQVVINEIMYHPAGDDPAGEFIELYNPSLFEAVDVSGWRLEGIGMTLPPGSVILPGRTMLVVESDAAFRQVHQGRFVGGEFDGGVANEGERLVLRDRNGRVVDEVEYDDVAPWPTVADGGGYSLELIDPSQDNARIAAWAPSLVEGGTPDAPNSVFGTLDPVPDLFISEVLPVNVSSVKDEAGEPAPWVELYNRSDATIDLDGMSMTDSHLQPQRWSLPDGIQLGGRQRLLIWADAETDDGPLHANFALRGNGGNGGIVALYAQNGRIIDSMIYDALPSDVSFGRFPDDALSLREFTTPTPGDRNQAAPVPVFLNEYNGVRADEFLKDDGEDVFWGRIRGNGGDWFELVAASDHLDLRGWQLLVTDETASDKQTTHALTFTDHDVWSDVRSGTIITVGESLPDDVSFDPLNGDWWINVQAGAGGTGTYITATDIKVSNKDWQLTVFDLEGVPVFGPVGEGIKPTSGIGKDEVFKLEEDPAKWIGVHSRFNDGSSSTFGAPNLYADGTVEQDFSFLRQEVLPCDVDVHCDDADACTLDECIADACVHTDVCEL